MVFFCTPRLWFPHLGLQEAQDVPPEIGLGVELGEGYLSESPLYCREAGGLDVLLTND